MVVKMMKWRPWPPLSAEKFEVKIVVHQLKGLNFLLVDGNDMSDILEKYGNLTVQIKWKGSKASALSLSSLRKSIRRNFTKEGSLGEDGVIEWNEEFFSVCNFIPYKEGSFYPWEVTFTIFNGSNRGQNEKVAVLFTGLLNLADLSSKGDQKDLEVCVPLEEISRPNNGNKPTLCLSVSLLETKNTQEPSEITGIHVPIPQPPSAKEGMPTERECHEDECSDRKSSVRSEDTDNIYPLDTDSFDDLVEGESDEVNESHSKSFTYESLARANHAGQLFYSCSSSSEDEGLIYYSHSIKDSGKCYIEDSSTSVINQSSIHGPISSILPWRKRKMSFKPFKEKGEPLLKKQYGDDGGDDIDHDRRQLSSSDESNLQLLKGEEDAVAIQSSASEFGDDSFAVGSWEQKEFLSRDGNLKLQTQVFFGSIDQRSEQAAGESACTALVAVIADWFQSNHDQMPIKSQLDSLIREGSLEWRNLCENEIYRERFPDKHFDLESVLEAKVRPLSVVPDKSFVGFFHPEGIEDEGFDFLHSAMSFDSIWDEISQSVPDSSSNADPLVYIVSWNDHFFVLKIEQDAFYIIDSLGERLFEGCNQAFILKFDRDTTIDVAPNETPKPDYKPATDNVVQTDTIEAASEEEEEESAVFCRGKESCKHYIKNFLAAIPVRQLQIDLKKGLMASELLHQRLQIEFHYTKCVPETNARFLFNINDC